ncbi:MAG: winged helix-turn-helix domain-containing protein [Candidatus Methanomethylicaceae archaeon]
MKIMDKRIKKIWDRKKRRGIDVIANILEITKNGAKKIRIMYLSNLSHESLMNYLNFLLKKNFLEYNSIEKKYRTTDKGMEFLKKIYEFKEIEEKYEEKIKIIEEMIGS